MLSLLQRSDFDINYSLSVTASNSSTETNDLLHNVFRIEPLIVSYIEISIAIISLFITIGLIIIMGSYFVYSKLNTERQVMMKNQQRMILGVLILCSIECVILLCRILYDSLNINFGLRFQYYAETYERNSTNFSTFDTLLVYNNTLNITPNTVGITTGQLVVYSISGAFELFFILVDVQVMIGIIWFVTLVFIETFRLSSGLLKSKKIYYFTKTVTILTIVNSIGLVVVNLAATILTILQKLQMISDDLAMYIYGICILMFLIQVSVQLIMLIVAAISVLRIISQFSEDKKKKKHSITKVLILQCGLFGCFIFEAIAFGFGVAQEDEALAHLALGYSTLNTLGILIFAFTALGLYSPIHILKKDFDHQGGLSIKSNNISSGKKSARGTPNSTHSMHLEETQVTEFEKSNTSEPFEKHKEDNETLDKI